MDGQKLSPWKRFLLFLRKKYRLVILNDATYGEKISIRLSPYGILITVLAITIVMTTAVISLVAFTPLREYIPGYGDIGERKQILELNNKADSIEQTLNSQDVYLNSILKAFEEKVETQGPKPKKDTTGKYRNVNTRPSNNDLQFRKDFEGTKNRAPSGDHHLKYSGLDELVFFTPVSGLVSESFNLLDDHYGVDIVTKKDETIKTTLDGTVIFTGFSAEDGNVIQVQHSNNLISIYKHCSSILKVTGDRVKSGESIAVVGNSGERSRGPHLHFELWFNGAPINPQEFVAF